MLRLGMMVSLRDYSILNVAESDFSELLLFKGDLESTGMHVDGLRRTTPRIEFVHVQEFMECEGSEVMVDLSSESESIRSSAVSVVRRTRDVARSLGCEKLIIHPGGIRDSLANRTVLLENLARSLKDLGRDGLLLENMPWYYWYRKSQRMVSNICVTIEDMQLFQDLVEGFTLDLCHGYLSCPDGDNGYNSRFVETLGQSVMHIHASDAKAPDHEGLQIGEGDVDFTLLRESSVPILVEIWNGHANFGEGFSIGMDRLRGMLR